MSTAEHTVASHGEACHRWIMPYSCKNSVAERQPSRGASHSGSILCSITSGPATWIGWAGPFFSYSRTGSPRSSGYQSGQGGELATNMIARSYMRQMARIVDAASRRWLGVLVAISAISSLLERFGITLVFLLFT